MFKTTATAAIMSLSLSLAATSQSLTPEQIAQMLDDQASAPNPYAALLNDPDQNRSLGAMKIMMESGDAALIDIALEHGLLSSSANVRRSAFEYYAATKPMLSLVVNGKELSGNDTGQFEYGVIERLKGQVDPEQVGHFRVRIGSYDPEQECFVWDGFENCGITFSTSGIFLSGSTINAKVEVSDDGVLRGSARFRSVGELVPIEIRLLR